MTMDPNELSADDLQALAEFRTVISQNGQPLSSALREATAYLKQTRGDVIPPSNPGSWDEYFSDPRRPSADFMEERYNPPPQERDLF